MKIFLLIGSLFWGFNSTAMHSDEIFEPTPSRLGPENLNHEGHVHVWESENACHLSRNGMGTGAIVTPVLSAEDAVRSVVVNEDRSTFNDTFAPLIGGYAHDGSDQQIAIIRYNNDGGFDTSFATTGIFTNDPSTGDDMIHSLNMLGGNTTYFAGRAKNSNVSWMIGRMTNTAVLDTSFYTTGVRISSFSTEDEIFRALGDQANGSTSAIYAAGYMWHTGRYNFVTAGFNADGALDTSFNTDGYDIQFMSANDSGALAMTYQNVSGTGDGPLTVGPVYNGIDWDFGAVRYLAADGSLDTSFATDGTTSFAVLSADDKPYAAIREADANAKKNLLGGYAYNGSNNDFAIVRLRTNGTLDTSYHTDGKQTTAIGSADDVIFAMAPYKDDSGLVYAVGSSDNAGNIDVAVARYLTNGVLDTSFHTDGKNTYDVKGANDVGASVYLPRRANWFYVGARVTNGATKDFGLLRIHSNGLLAASGQPSDSFGTNGRIVTNISGTDTPSAIAYNSSHASFNDIIYSAGTVGDDVAIAVYNLEAATLDTAFHTDGLLTQDLGTISENIRGINFLGGNNSPIWFVGNNAVDFVVMRLPGNGTGDTQSGALDTAFSTDGYTTIDFSGTDVGYSISSSRIIAGKDGSATSLFAVARIETSGLLDTTFDTDGKNTFGPTANAATAYYSGAIQTTNIVAGEDTTDFVVISVNTSGQLNTSFSTDGKITIDFGGTETFGGAGLNTTGIAGARTAMLVGGNGSDFCIARIGTDGNLDTTFSTDGKLTLDFGTVSEKARSTFNITATNKWIIGGDNGTDYMLARLFSDGTLDTTFDTDGKQIVDVSGTETMAGLVVTDPGDICAVGPSNGSADFGIVCLTQ